MEFGDILIFVLAAIGMIISAVAKSAKKRTEAQKTMPDFDEWFNNDENTTHVDTPTVAYEVEDPYEVQKSYWSYDQETIKKIETSSQIDDLHREHKHLPVEDTAYKIKKESDEVGEAVFKDGFNLRNAIIYAELLTPKFKEY